VEIVGLNTPGTSTSLPTRINGGASKNYQGITSIVFNLNGGTTGLNTGDDVIVITKLALTGGVTINTGDGDNFYGIGDFDNSGNHADAAANTYLGAVTLGGGLVVNMGNGTDLLLANHATFNGSAGQNLAINAGNAHTILSFENTAVSHLAAFNVSMDSGSLDLTLDHFSANYLTVNCSIGNDSISLGDNTHVNFAIIMSLNYGDDIVDFDHVTAGSVYLALGQGANQFTGTSDQITGATTILSGAQSDTVTLTDYSTNSLSTALAGGGNTLSLTNVIITNAAMLGGGIGVTAIANTVTLDHVTAGSLNITSGLGNDAVSLTSVTVAKAFNIDTGAGNDTVTIDGLQASSFWGMFETGADVVSIANSTITGNAMFGGGMGSDTFNDNGGNTFNPLNKVNFELPVVSAGVTSGTEITGTVITGSTSGGSISSAGGTLTITNQTA
jgi:hypothetical protein